MSAQLVGSNALFLHIPKTGGTWVEQALIQTGVQTAAPPTIQGVTYRHCLLSMLEKRHPFVFTFVRHPLSWSSGDTVRIFLTSSRARLRDWLGSGERSARPDAVGSNSPGPRLERK